MPQLQVESPNVTYSDAYIESQYFYHSTIVDRKSDGTIKAVPTVTKYTLRTERTVPKLGVMLVGWGGNNGSTVTAMVLANRLGLSWHTKEGVQKANYYGSITQASTVLLGYDSIDGTEVFNPLRDFVPMVNPNDIVFDGWDISSMNIADAMHRAKVLDYHLQETLHPLMKNMKPRPAIFDPDFVAANQKDRADNVLHGTKAEQVDIIRSHIREFKANSGVDVVIVVWTANTERMCDVRRGINDTAENLMNAIRHDQREISPSTLYAVASAMEGCSFINGSPQNTLVPGLVELARERGVFIAGDDFKSGQTKLKSVLVDFLVSAGIKPRSIVSYNHLGNNDGLNLSAPSQFKSKEESKKGVVEDMVASNHMLYRRGEAPDHCIVIKYVPYVGDSKRAMDEYVNEIAMGGSNTIVIHNTCEDSLLASPLILDLVILAELMQRVHIKATEAFEPFNTVLSLLGYLLKAPLVPEGAPIVNALFRQRAAIENLLRALVGLPSLNHMDLEHRLRTQGAVKPGDQSSGVSSDEELHQEP